MKKINDILETVIKILEIYAIIIILKWLSAATKITNAINQIGLPN